MKKVVVITTIIRAGSNSQVLAEQFAEGAKAAGNEVEFISLRGKEIKFACDKGLAPVTNNRGNIQATQTSRLFALNFGEYGKMEVSGTVTSLAVPCLSFHFQLRPIIFKSL